MYRLSLFVVLVMGCQGSEGDPAQMRPTPGPSTGGGSGAGPNTSLDAGGSDAFDAGTSEPDAGTMIESDAGPRADAGVPSAKDAGSDAGSPGVYRYDAGPQGNGKFDIGPNYTADPDSSSKMGVPKGKVYSFEMDSKTSAIYPGVTGPYKRAVSVYVPNQYVNGTPAPFIVVQDGQGYVARMRNALDNLIAQKRVPVIAAILINPGPGDGRGSERGLEYDRVNADYTRFIETEVLPIIPQRPDLKADYPNFRFTSDPDARATMGCSSGGAAAFTMGWFRPDLYRRILTYSGTFVNQHPEPSHPLGAWEYHQKLIAQTPIKPLRVFLHVGENDLNLNQRFNDMEHDWPKANRDMYAALSAKGYEVRFLFAKASGHCDGRVFDQELPKSLEWLWRGYPIP